MNIIVFGKIIFTENQVINNKRNYQIIKSNDLIQKTRYNLSLQEQKILHYIFSQVKPTDTQLKRYTFSISDFCKVCGIDYKNGGNYVYLKRILKDMSQHIVWITIIENGEEKETILRIIDKPFINRSKGIIEIKLDDIMKQYLLQLKEKYTEYNLMAILPMKSKYSPRIYEILKSYSNQKFIRTTVEKFRKILMIDEKLYPVWNDFKKRVLDKSVSEINNFSDISVSYKTGKVGRKVNSITFFIEKKESNDLINTWDSNITILDKKETSQLLE